jgi:SAM-dependent methyltransferase
LLLSTTGPAPATPPKTIADLLGVCGVHSSSRILEIGCGTGQLTRDIAPTGARIICVEPGPFLADTARANLGGFANVDVVTTTFEDFGDLPSSFDLLVSATAFDWIDPNLSYAKAATLLKEGGRLALVTNTHSHGGSHKDERITEPVRSLHRRLTPNVGDWEFPMAEEIRRKATAGGDIATVWARVERKLSKPPAVAHLFDPPTVRTYRWLASYLTDTYLAMLASQSSYVLMELGRREELLAGIGAIVDEELGGRVTKEYVSILAVAERRGHFEEER